MKSKYTTIPVNASPKILDDMLEQETSLKATDFDDAEYQPYGVEVLYSADESKRKGRLRVSSTIAAWGVGVVGTCVLGVGLYFVHHYPW